MLIIQVRCRSQRKEKLRPIVIFTAGGHSDKATTDKAKSRMKLVLQNQNMISLNF